MRLPCRVLPLALIAAVSLSGRVASTQDAAVPAPATAPSNITLVASTARPTYTLRDTIPVTYQVTNIGKAPIYIPKGFEATACLNLARAAYIFAWLDDAGGRRSSAGYGSSCAMSIPPVRLSLSEKLSRGAMLLAPGDRQDGALQVALHPLAVAGRANLGIDLHAWATSDFDAVERAQLKSQGVVLLDRDVTTTVAVTLTQ
jgi:hypothetical protein